jgi:phage shock protein PspC (stress-responsive transcriptional regulator)
MNNNKKLYKNKNDVAVAGVCSGLAEYLNMEVSVVRILTVAIVLFTGIGIIPYIILAIVLPDKSEVVHNDEKIYEEPKKDQEDDLYEYDEEEYKL